MKELLGILLLVTLVYCEIDSYLFNQQLQAEAAEIHALDEASRS